MAEKFTPGEWYIEDFNEWGIAGKFVVDKDKEPIAKVCNQYHKIPDLGSLCRLKENMERMQANAALLAASPRMYRALEDVCSDCERHANWEDAHNLGIPVGQPCPCKDCYVEKALKKARGEAI